MKILVTGAKGQLGREICECFKRGYTELGCPDILKKKNEIYPIDIDTLDISKLSDVLSLSETLPPLLELSSKDTAPSNAQAPKAHTVDNTANNAANFFFIFFLLFRKKELFAKILIGNG